MSKNKLLQKEKLKYLKVAERCEYNNRNWIPVELSHFFDNDERNRKKYASVSEMIDWMTDMSINKKRLKNGRILTGENNAKNYRYLKKSLEIFTKQKYYQEFSGYLFRDINKRFIQDYILDIQKQGARKGNGGGLFNKMRCLHTTFTCAKRNGIYNIDMSVFTPIREQLKPYSIIPKSVSYNYTKIRYPRGLIKFNNIALIASI